MTSFLWFCICVSTELFLKNWFTISFVSNTYITIKLKYISNFKNCMVILFPCAKLVALELIPEFTGGSQRYNRMKVVKND